MRPLWGALTVTLVAIFCGHANAQITGTVNLCGGSITFTAGSATADTNTSCNPFETYTYASTAATAPYASSLYIPAIPNSSGGTLQHIPASAFAEVGQANTFSGANNFTSTFEISGTTQAFPTSGSIAGVTDTQTLTNKTLTSPTISNPTISGTVTGSGILAVGNLATASQSTTVNGQTCTLAASCTITATATGITVGTTTVSSGTNGNVEYNNSGVLGEKAVTGSGNVVLATSPTIASASLTNPVITGSLTATGLVTNSALASGSFSNITGVGTLTSLTASGNITDNLSGSAAPATNSGIQVVGAASTAVGVQGNAFAQTVNFLGQRADGTPASPTAVTTGDNLAGLFANGYNGSAYSGNVAAIIATAAQGFTTGAEGTRFGFYTTANGATANSEVMRLDQNGALLVPASQSNPGAFGLSVGGPAVFNGSATFNGAITATGLGSGTVANSICSTSAGVLLSINAANCFGGGSGAVSSVTGTAGQVTASPTTGAVVVSLPSTLTPSETISGQWSFTGGAVIPPVSTPCGASITPTIGTQKIECTVSAATTLNVPSPFVAGETYSITLQEPSSSPFPISVAANITIPGGGIAILQQPTAGDRDKLVCETTVIGGNNSLDCGQLDQLRQPPSYHVGCHNNTGSTVSSVACTFTNPYTPPVGSVLLVGFEGGSGTATSLYSSATFGGGSCTVPSSTNNTFVYNSTFTAGYYETACQVTSAGATGITINFSSSVTGAVIFADVINNSFGIDATNANTTATASSTPSPGTISPTQQDMVWSWLSCGSCGTVTAGTSFAIGQNVASVGATEYGILPAGGAPSPQFNVSAAAGYGATVTAVLP